MEEKSGKTDLDLEEPVNATVIQSMREPSGKALLMEIDGCLHLFHHDEDLVLGRRLVERLKAEQGWFEKLIHHGPSIGTFYEDSL